MSVTVTGTNSASGAAVTKSTITDADGKYKFILGPGTYQVSPADRRDANRGRQRDCSASGGTCTVSMSQDRTANFTIACAPTLDFHTSMVATGCFQPKGPLEGAVEGEGPVPDGRDRLQVAGRHNGPDHLR